MPRLASASLDQAIALYRVKFNRERFRILSGNAAKCEAVGISVAAEAFKEAADHAAGQVAKCCDVLGIAGDGDVDGIKSPRLTVGEHEAFMLRNDEHRKICNSKDRRAFKTAYPAVDAAHASMRSSLQLTPGR